MLQRILCLQRYLNMSDLSSTMIHFMFVHMSPPENPDCDKPM